MSLYLGTNILVALLTPEPLSERADEFVRNHPERLIVSNFASAARALDMAVAMP